MAPGVAARAHNAANIDGADAQASFLDHIRQARNFNGLQRRKAGQAPRLSSQSLYASFWSSISTFLVRKLLKTANGLKRLEEQHQLLQEAVWSTMDLSLKPREHRWLSTSLFAAVVFVARFTTTNSALSRATFSTCPAFRSPEVDSLRLAYLSSGISSLEGCYASLSTRPSSSRQSAASSSVIGSFLSRAGQLSTTAVIACTRILVNATGNETDPSMPNDQEDEPGICQSAAASIPRLSAQSAQTFNLWFSTCASPPPPTNTTPSHSQVEAGLLNCVRLLSTAANLTKLAVSTSCLVLQNSSANLTYDESLCSPTSFLPLDSLLQGFTNTACRSIFTVDALATFLKLEGLETQLRSSFGIGHLPPEAQIANFSVSEQGRLVLCSALFPPHTNRQLTTGTTSTQIPPGYNPLCENACHRLKNSITTLVRFIDQSKTPFLSLLQTQTEQLCEKENRKNSQCVDFYYNATSFRRLSSQTPQELFCLNITCHFPLRETSNPDHWAVQSQTQLRGFFTLGAALYPEAALPFNGSELPCGTDCASVIFTADEEYQTRITRNVFGTISVLCNVIAIITFSINRRKLTHIARRLNLYVNISYVLGPGGDTLFAPYPDIYKKISCYSDGTLRLKEPVPGEVSGGWCVLFSFKYQFFGFTFLYLLLCMAREWYLMVSTLATVNKRDKDSQENAKRKEIVYVLGSMAVSAALNISSVARRKVQGSPERGTCYVEISESFYFGVLPYSVVAVIMMGYLFRGLPKLYHVYKGASVFRQRMDDAHKMSAGKQKSALASLKGLDSLMKLLFLYTIATTLSLLAITPAFAYLFARDDGIKADIERHLRCMMSSCMPESCPPLPSADRAVIMVPEIYFPVAGTIISFWAFNWSAYWKDHMPCRKSVSETRRRLLSSLSNAFSMTSTDSATNDQRTSELSTIVTSVEPAEPENTIKEQTNSAAYSSEAPQRNFSHNENSSEKSQSIQTVTTSERRLNFQRQSKVSVEFVAEC